MKETMPRTPFSTPLSGSARETEIRIRNIFSGPKKRPPALFLALVFSACLLCGNLVSCQVKETEQEESSTSLPEGPPQEQTPPDAPAAAEPDLGWNSFSAQKQADPPAVDPDPAARAAYAGLLEGRLSESGQFALCDVTGLGTEDLILFQGDACTVYSYFPESGTLECVLEESANILFFENGSAVVAWSHNAGKGGRFWPYIHYRYNPGYQVYSPADNVDAFDRQIAEDNGFLDQYPQEADTSNAGFVYYFIDEEGGYSDPVDLSYYRDWWEGYFHNVSPMKLPLVDLTAANISALT